jgi:AraC-like DNA-binding protein
MLYRQQNENFENRKGKTPDPNGRENGRLTVRLNFWVQGIGQICTMHGEQRPVFLPGGLLHDVFPDPSALHGRMLSPRLPEVRYLVGRVLSFASSIRNMVPEAAHRDLREIVLLIANAFGEQAGLKGSKPALARAMAFDQARRYVQANLHDDDLSPERVVALLGLSRPTVYRLFQHEGGLGTYIRHARLRGAAAELIAWPGIPVQDIAYAHGFRSASDFTRTFRRVYGVAPQEIRQIT